MPAIRQIQLGKQGVTENFLSTLKNQFKNCKNVRISVLSNARKNKNDVKKYSEEILEKLNSRPRTVHSKTNLLPTTKSFGKKYTARIIGFKIVIKKWRQTFE